MESADSTTAAGSRKIKLTAKANDERLQRVVSAKKSKLGQLTSRMNQMVQLMDEGDDGNLQIVQTMLAVQFNKLFGEFCELNTTVKALLQQISEDEMNEDQDKWFEPRANTFEDFLERAKVWMKEVHLRITESEKHNEEVEPSDSVSAVSVTSYVTYMEELDRSVNMRSIISKLPYKLREWWRAIACGILDKQQCRVKFSDLVDFVNRQAREASHPVFGSIMEGPRNQAKGEQHSMEHCKKMKRSLHKEKIDFLSNKVLHMKARAVSTEDKHKGVPSDNDEGQSVVSGCTGASTCGATTRDNVDSILAVVPMQVKIKKGNKWNTSILLKTMGGKRIVTSHLVSGLEVSTLENNDFFELPNVFSQTAIPAREENIPRQENVARVEDGYSTTGEPVQGLSNRISLATLDELWNQQFKNDFPECQVDQLEMSRDKIQFMEIVSQSASLVGGHYCINLPLRNRAIKMPNNQRVAEQRALNLKRQFVKNSQFQADYASFLNDVIAKGYAVEIPCGEMSRDDGKVWYLPHHGVYHPRKRKIRVVFDCGASYQGTTLNCQLLQGPDITSTLLGVIIRFRQEEVAVMADVEAMFHQVKVPDEDADHLRFL
ncbi:hypothetical protein AOLI_G00098600 [Acnodon oligacanthus]